MYWIKYEKLKLLNALKSDLDPAKFNPFFSLTNVQVFIVPTADNFT